MKNQILNMGTILSSAQQKQVFGGNTLSDSDGGCQVRGTFANGCLCNYNNDCVSGNCDSSRSIGTCKAKTALTDI